MQTRTLGRSGIEVGAMGLGCWAIGGPFWREDTPPRRPLGWSGVDDQESIRAIHRALDLGVNFFDTADAYGCGHSERILAKALEGRRREVVIATKFGGVFEEETMTWWGHRHPNGVVQPEFVRQACEASLRRLNTETIDLYLFHWNDYEARLAPDLLPILEDLVTQGKIRWYGWSTDNPQSARLFAQGEHCAAIQHDFNFIERNDEMLAVCDQYNLASINRDPLMMGLLTGKFRADSQLPEDDVRSAWNFHEGPAARVIQQLEKVRQVLTREGHTLAQASLAWIWAYHPRTIPIPGFKTTVQVEENAGALSRSPLTRKQMAEINAILGFD